MYQFETPVRPCQTCPFGSPVPSDFRSVVATLMQRSGLGVANLPRHKSLRDKPGPPTGCHIQESSEIKATLLFLATLVGPVFDGPAAAEALLLGSGNAEHARSEPFWATRQPASRPLPGPLPQQAGCQPLRTPSR